MCKRNKCTVIILVILLSLVLAACSEVSSSAPADESPLNSALTSQFSSAPVEHPVLSNEELDVIKAQISKNNPLLAPIQDESGNRHFYEFTVQMYEEAVTNMGEQYMSVWADEPKYVASDITTQNYHSEKTVKQLKTGLFANEVYDLLGNPHWNIKMIHPGSVMFSLDGSCYDFYTVYLLNTGRVLVLRYKPMFAGAYERSELMQRIPTYAFYEQINSKWAQGRWGELSSIEIMTADEFCAMKISKKDLKTAEEHLPKQIPEETFLKIKSGMTYEEVVTLFGSFGYDEKRFSYSWSVLTEDQSKKNGAVYFSENDQGETVVSRAKLGSKELELQQQQ